MSKRLLGLRSLLYLPASNPRAIARAREAGADMVILDLEDAVKPELKDEARQAAVVAVGDPWPCPVAVRLNGIGSRWHEQDVTAIAGSAADFVVIPRATAPRQVTVVRAETGKPVLAMIESAAGLLQAPGIAGEAAALIAGTNDLAADLRLPPGAGRPPLQLALQGIIIAARAGGVAAFDGVYNRLEDEDGFAAECREGRNLGFDGKTLIHPRQIAPCHAAFAPTVAEIDRAQRLLAAYGGGAERFENEMIERMHIDSATRLLQIARVL